MDLAIDGEAVVKVCFNAALHLLTSSGKEIILEGDSLFQPSGGRLSRFDPENPESQAAGLIALKNDVILSADSALDGGLVVRFESGASISTPPDDDYEAWSVLTPRGGRIVCMPGGELAEWPAAT